jgi:uncharacterized protein (TIGR03067 family)
MRRAILFVLVIAALPVSGAPAPWPKSRPDRRSDLEQLQGEWELDHIRNPNRDGRTHKCEPGDVRLTISGRRYFIKGRFGKGDEGLLTIDSTSRPKRIDFGWGDVPRNASREVMDATTAYCIYQIEGDVLTIRYGDSTVGRPTNFTKSPRPMPANFDIYVYKRKARER